MRIQRYWLLVFLFFAAGLYFFYQVNQPFLSYDFAPQFDGNDYRGIYEYFTGMTGAYKVPFPFNGRLLVPWLASLVGTGDIIWDFRAVNLLFTLLGVFMLFELWRTLGFERHWFLFGIGWLCLHWTGLIRLNAFDPITVDVPTYFFQALLLWLVLKRRFVWLLLLGPIATLQKESIIGVLAVLALFGFLHNRKAKDGFFDLKWILLAFVLSYASKLLIGHFFPPAEAGKGAFITLAYHAKEALLHPFEFVRWAMAAFVAFGPILLVGLSRLRLRGHYDMKRMLLLSCSSLYLAYGILAGGDMTRIIFLGFPFIMTWLIYELKELPRPRVWLLAILSLPLTFLVSHIPDPAFSWDVWESWYPEFASSSVVGFYAAYGLFTMLLWFGFKKWLPD